MDKFRIDLLLERKLVGKTLKSLGFGGVTCRQKAEDEGERYIPLPCKITKIWLSTECKDVILRFEIEGQEDFEESFYIYDNEDIEVD